MKSIFARLVGRGRLRRLRGWTSRAASKPRLDIVPLMTEAGARPILLDIGSAGSSPKVWQSLAPVAALVGFEPDQRNPDATFGRGFQRAVKIDKVVVADDTVDEADLILTEYPSCSSLLEPDLDSLGEFSFRDYFKPVRRQRVAAASLNRLFAEHRLEGAHWLKVDSQGLDLQLLKSISPGYFGRLLAVDIEPGFIDAYKGEDLFPECHAWLKGQDFWLAELNCQAYPKVRPETLAALEVRGYDRAEVLSFLHKSPTAAEARYFRSVKWLEQNARDPAVWAMTCAFALVSDRLGFALDVRATFVKLFPPGPVSRQMNLVCDAALSRLLT